MTLSVQQQMLIEHRVTNLAKSTGIAYLLLIFMGGMGIHRFYLGRVGSGAAMLLIFALGWLTLVFGVGLLLLLVVGLWAFADLFLIPGMVEKDKATVRRDMEHQMLMAGPEANSAPALADGSEASVPHLPGARRT